MLNRQYHHVAAGNYYVGHTTPLILQAFLGTCVGVAMIDDHAGVGGLIHLLLPEPVSREGQFQPEKYASTGLPVFLRTLYNEGASRSRLKAYLAGGALVGPLEDRDLQLDIGGRTAETAMNILADDDIRIEKTETGGLFTCCLSLDMQNGDCRIEPTGLDRLSTEAQIQIPSAADIAETMDAIRPIPQVALKILRLIDQEEYEIKALAEEIRKDQVISARTLKLCNSVMFAGRNRIASLDQALVFLGIKLLVKYVISASVENFFPRAVSGYSLCKGGLFHHAVGTAIISEKLATVTAKVNPGTAYTAGLLHDIGKVVLDQYITSAYPLFYRRLYEEEKNFLEAELAILGNDHTEVGSDLAQKWSFPEALIETIRHHHRPEGAGMNPELTHVVYLADLIMARFHSGLELERLNTEELPARLAAIGLSKEKLAGIVDCLPVKVFESSPEMAMIDR